MGMNLDTGGQRRHDETSVLPLINVVFLLLAFFIIAGQLTPFPPFEVQPPTATSEPATRSAPPVVIHISRDGAFAIDSRRASPDHIEQRLAAMVGQQPAPHVRVVADEQVDATTVIAFLQRMRQAGVTTTALTTRQP